VIARPGSKAELRRERETPEQPGAWSTFHHGLIPIAEFVLY
jgi:hypothetical protein